MSRRGLHKGRTRLTENGDGPSGFGIAGLSKVFALEQRSGVDALFESRREGQEL